jgi:hypothetical protein
VAFIIVCTSYADVSANETTITGPATIRASADFDANCEHLGIEDVEKGLLMVSVVRDAKLCLNDIRIVGIELDGRIGTSLGRIGNLRQASVGIYARSDVSAATSGAAANHSGACGARFTMERVRCHDVNVQCIGISDWTNITLKNSSLAHIGNAEYRGYGSDTLAKLSRKCGGQRWAWCCGYMHTLYFTRTETALIENTDFDDAMFGSALDLTEAFNTRVANCSFSNIRQSVVYHANGGYTRQADNTSIEGATVVNCSSVATIGSPHLTISGLHATAVRFGFYLHGGLDSLVSKSVLHIGGDTPSAADTSMPASLILADGGHGLSLSGVDVSFGSDAHGASLVVLDTQKGDAPSSGDAVSAIVISNVTVSGTAMDFILDCVSTECGGLAQDGLEVSASVLPRMKSNVNWPNATDLLKLDNQQRAVLKSDDNISFNFMSPPAKTPMTPMLFMLPSDTHDPWGLQFPVAPPPVNLSAECVGVSCYDRPPSKSTVLSSPIVAVFDRDDGALDVVQSSASGRLLWSSVTTEFANFTGKRNRTYFLKEDLPPKCHIKDFAKKPGVPEGAADGYLFALFCESQPHGHNGAVFLSGDIHKAGSFRTDPSSRFNFTTPNFHDHDDIHLIWQDQQWIDYQISFQQWTTGGFEPHPVRCNDVPARYTCKNSSGGGVCAADPNGSFVDKAACLPVCMPQVHEKLLPCNESVQTLKYCDVRATLSSSTLWSQCLSLM